MPTDGSALCRHQLASIAALHRQGRRRQARIATQCNRVRFQADAGITQAGQTAQVHSIMQVSQASGPAARVSVEPVFADSCSATPSYSQAAD